MTVKPNFFYASLFVFVCGLLGNLELYAQNDIITRLEKDCKCPEFDKSQSFSKLLPIGKSPNEIEVRFVSYNMNNNVNYSIISYDRGKYAGVYYVNKCPHFVLPKPGKSLYNRYVIENTRLDTVMDKLLKLGVSNWKNPGYRNTDIADLGVMDIHYKIRQDTGSYRFQPPKVLLEDHPNIKAYETLTEIVKVFQTLTENVYYDDAIKKGYKIKSQKIP